MRSNRSFIYEMYNLLKSIYYKWSTTENQINILKEIAKLKGYEIVREFTDKVLFGFF